MLSKVMGTGSLAKNGGIYCKTVLFMGINRHLLLFLYTSTLVCFIDFIEVSPVSVKFYGIFSYSAYLFVGVK